MSQHLFVYGTLRADLAPAALAARVAALPLVGSARVRGRLYDLGAYPGAVLDPNSEEWIQGEVVELVVADGDLVWLDRYEGYDAAESVRSLFVRERCLAWLNGGERSLDCWIYVYNRDATGLPRVGSGDWQAKR